MRTLASTESFASLEGLPNTLELSHLWITEPLLGEVQSNPNLVIETDFEPIPFDVDGTLDQESLFPDSVRGRRAARVAHA